MPISIQCPECEKRLKVADSAAGKKIRCPACKAVIAIPAAEELVEPDDLVEPDEETAVSETPVRKKKKPDLDEDEPAPKKRKKSEDDEGYGYADDEDEEEERPRKKKKKRRYDDDDYRPSRRTESHRGVLILVLGILSIVVACLCPLICWILAAIAVNMANADKPKMERGLMDRSGETMTTAGQVCAYVGTLLGLINCIAGAALRMGGQF